jgi:hypothetical protein
MAPIRLTDRQMEIVQNVAEYVPRGLRDRYLELTAAYLCEGFVNDRTVAIACSVHWAAGARRRLASAPQLVELERKIVGAPRRRRVLIVSCTRRVRMGEVFATGPITRSVLGRTLGRRLVSVLAALRKESSGSR